MFKWGRVLRRKAASTQLGREAGKPLIHMYLRFCISIWPLISLIGICGTYFFSVKVLQLAMLNAVALGALAGVVLSFCGAVSFGTSAWESSSKESKLKDVESFSALNITLVFAAAMLYMPMFLGSIFYGVMGLVFFFFMLMLLMNPVGFRSDKFEVDMPAWLWRAGILVLALASVFYGDALGYSPILYSAVAFVFVLWFLIKSDKMILARYKGA